MWYEKSQILIENLRGKSKKILDYIDTDLNIRHVHSKILK